MRKVTLHKKEIVLNKSKLKNILDKRGLTYIQFYEKIIDKYGLDLSYKGFMGLLKNRSSWKLLYAFAIVDILKVDILDIFDVIDVDINRKREEKQQWKDKYEKDGKGL